MDIVWIGFAFALGLAARQIGLPPLVGYLVAGFALNGFGVSSSDTLEHFAEMGITLLLFSIGLKLRLNSLARPEVWAVASLHMLITVALFGLGFFLLATLGLSVFAGMDLKVAVLLAFALSFSSTVFAVKVLEEKGETAALYGRISIGILIIQDIAAVVFLGFSAGKIPTVWALGLLALIPLRHLLFAILQRSGHGELLVLYGLTLALGGAQLFELVSIKGDLGALILGVMLANHPKSGELAKSLLGFKDLFLVGFFLGIGLSGTPTMASVGTALLLVALVPFKVGLFLWLMMRFKLRARTSLLGSLNLANYSEFGLIVGAIGAKNGWISSDWLITIAIALAITFVAASPLNTHAYQLYQRWRDRLRSRETEQRVPDEAMIDARHAEILVVGMGRVGSGAYDVMQSRYGNKVVGIDFDTEQVEAHRKAGRDVLPGSATDPDFWSRIHVDRDLVRLVMLAMPNHSENLFAVEQLKEAGYHGRIVATAKYPDQIDALTKAGADAAYNIYAEAGVGFADHVCEQFAERSSPA